MFALFIKKPLLNIKSGLVGTRVNSTLNSKDHTSFIAAVTNRRITKYPFKTRFFFTAGVNTIIFLIQTFWTRISLVRHQTTSKKFNLNLW